MKINRAGFTIWLLLLPFVLCAPARDFLKRAAWDEHALPLRSTLLRSDDWRDQLAGAVRVSEAGYRSYYHPRKDEVEVNWELAHNDSLRLGEQYRDNLVVLAWLMSLPDLRFLDSPNLFVTYDGHQKLSVRVRQRLKRLQIFARHGEKLEPENGFWIWHQARFFLLEGRETEALAALRRAARAPVFRTRLGEVTQIGGRSFWPAPDSPFGVALAHFTESSSGISYQALRQFEAIAISHRARGQHVRAFEILSDLLKLGRLLRANATTLRELEQSEYVSAVASFPELPTPTPVPMASSPSVAPAQMAPVLPTVGPPSIVPLPTPTPLSLRLTKPKTVNADVSHFRIYEGSLPFYARQHNATQIARDAEKAWLVRAQDLRFRHRVYADNGRTGAFYGVSGAVWSAALWPEWLARRLLPFFPLVVASAILSFWFAPQNTRRTRGAFLFLILAWPGLITLLFSEMGTRLPPLGWWQNLLEPVNTRIPDPVWVSMALFFMGVVVSLGLAISHFPSKKNRVQQIFGFSDWGQLARKIGSEFRVVFHSLRGELPRDLKAPTRRAGFSSVLVSPGFVIPVLFAFAAVIGTALESATMALPGSILNQALLFAAFGTAIYLAGWQVFVGFCVLERVPFLRVARNHFCELTHGAALGALTVFWLLFLADWSGAHRFQREWNKVQTRGELAIVRAQDGRQ